MSTLRSLAAACSLLFVALWLTLFVSGANDHLAASGSLLVRPRVLFIPFSALYLLMLLVWLYATQGWILLVKTFRDNVFVIGGFAALALVSLLWSQMRNAYWHDGAIYILLPSYSFMVFALACTIPLIAPCRRYWQIFFLMPLIVLLVTLAIDITNPGTFGRINARAAGFLENSNQAAYATAALCAMLIQYRKINILNTSLMIICGFAIFSTFSRGGMLCFILLTAIYVSSIRIQINFKNILLLGTCGVLLLGAILFAAPHIVGKAEMFSSRGAQSRMEMFAFEKSLDDSSIKSRQDLIVDAVEQIKRAPILGHGTGYSRFAPVAPHNMYLTLWMELGIVGLGLYVWILVAGYRLFSERDFWPGKALILVVAVQSLFSHTVLQEFQFLIGYGFLLTLSWFNAHGPAEMRVRQRRHRRSSRGEAVGSRGRRAHVRGTATRLARRELSGASPRGSVE